MAHLIQVGAGSGGMVVLDLVARDPRITAITLIDPDVYQPHNAERHYFGAEHAGKQKVDLAADWLRSHRPDLKLNTLAADLLSPIWRERIEQAVGTADLGVCAADNEIAKLHWDALMRRHGKPWTLGEVLSGGIGGFVHLFQPGGACYGCVASALQREVHEPDRPPATYADGDGQAEATRVPASKASIHALASLHAVLTLGLLDDPSGYDPGFTSLLLSLRATPDLFEQAFHPHRLRIARAPECLVCRPAAGPDSPRDLDAALQAALERLNHA
jgi:hypothetical protein